MVDFVVRETTEERGLGRGGVGLGDGKKCMNLLNVIFACSNKGNSEGNLLNAIGWI